MIRRLAAALTLALVTSAANAAVVVNINEVGNTVVANATGSLDLTDAVFVKNVTVIAAVNPNLAVLSMANGPINGYAITGPASFGTKSLTQGTGNGMPFYIFGTGNLLGVAQGYSSGSPLFGNTRWDNASFVSLGITPGSYVYSLPNDTVTLNFGAVAAAEVPLPAGLPLLGLGLAALAGLRRRRTESGQTA